MIEEQRLIEKNQESELCDLCKNNYATTTVDTPREKDVPLCDNCFKKINSILGVMKGKGEMSLEEIWKGVKDETN